MRAIFLILLTILSGFFFYQSSIGITRKTHTEILHSLIKHPEFIPKASDVRLVSSWFDQMVADFYWLSSIQYVGGNVFDSEYKRYLYRMLDLITDLSPHFYYPYEVGLLLLPGSNPRYEKFSQVELEKNITEAVALGEKGMKYSCNAEKAERIKAEEDLLKIWNSPEYANPCREPIIPYYLAYVEYWSRKDAQAASNYYKIASANADTPKAARVMSAIMRGKSGDRQKAILMFLSLAESIENEKQTDCRALSGEMREILSEEFAKNARVRTEFLKQVEKFREKIVDRLGEQSTLKTMDSLCSTYLDKAVRELNLSYVEEYDRDFIAHSDRKPGNAMDLFRWGGIPYLPRDPQKFESDDLEVIYVRNPKTGKWDYETGKYY